MKIPLENITSSGLQIRFDETSDVLSAAINKLHAPTGVCISPFVSGQISLIEKGSLYLINGRITAHVSLQCSRCLKAFEIEQTIDLRFSARTVSGDQPYRDMALLDAQPDEIVVLEDELDLGELIVQEVCLNLPLQPLCRKDCPGLCPRCGRLKGSEECRCEDEKEIDPRWQKLMKMRGK